MIHDKIDNFKNYPYGKIWLQAFQFIIATDKDSEEKRYELNDGMYASIECYKTKSIESAVFESHRKYVDIQWTINGAESFHIEDILELQVSKEYDSERDICFYKTPSLLKVEIKQFPRNFSVFWPNDAHMPQLYVDGFKKVKKGVVKVPVELLFK